MIIETVIDEPDTQASTHTHTPRAQTHGTRPRNLGPRYESSRAINTAQSQEVHAHTRIFRRLNASAIVPSAS